MAKTENDDAIAQEASAPPAIAASAVREQAERHLLPMSDQDAERWSAEIAAGRATPETLAEWMRTQAAGLYPAHAEAISAGVEPAVLFSVWRSLASRELERDVALNESVFLEGIAEAPTVSDFRAYIRSLPEWEETEGAARLADGLTRRLIGEVVE